MFGVFNSILSAEAASINVGVLNIDYPGSPGSLFNVTNIVPGYSETKALAVTNNGNVPHSFSIAVSGTLGSLADAIVIEPKVLGVIVWSKKISEIIKYPDSNVIIGSIAPGGTANVDITASLPLSSGNSYQGLSTLPFNFLVGNEITDTKEPSVGIGGTSGGVIQRVAGRIRSLVIGSNNSGSVPPVVAPLSNATEGDQSATGESTNGKAAGVSTSSETNCFWWWLLSILLVIITAICRYFDPKKRKYIIRAIPLFLAGILYPVHLILHNYYQPVKACDYFIWIELVILLIYYINLYYTDKKQEDNSK